MRMDSIVDILYRCSFIFKPLVLRLLPFCYCNKTSNIYEYVHVHVSQWVSVYSFFLTRFQIFGLPFFNWLKERQRNLPFNKKMRFIECKPCLQINAPSQTGWSKKNEGKLRCSFHGNASDAEHSIYVVMYENKSKSRTNGTVHIGIEQTKENERVKERASKRKEWNRWQKGNRMSDRMSKWRRKQASINENEKDKRDGKEKTNRNSNQEVRHRQEQHWYNEQ